MEGVFVFLDYFYFLFETRSLCVAKVSLCSVAQTIMQLCKQSRLQTLRPLPASTLISVRVKVAGHLLQFLVLQFCRATKGL